LKGEAMAWTVEMELVTDESTGRIGFRQGGIVVEFQQGQELRLAEWFEDYLTKDWGE
jgi:hypothetical protein